MNKNRPQHEDISLDAFRSTDLELLNKWQNQSQDRQLALGFSFPVSDRSTRDWLDSRLHKLEKFPTSVYWAIRGTSGNIFGYTVLSSIDYLNANAEVGIYLGLSRNSGLGSKALEMTLQKAFNQFHLHKVTARIVDSNKPAIALFTKLNFEPEGELVEQIKLNNIWHNLLLFAKKN